MDQVCLYCLIRVYYYYLLYWAHPSPWTSKISRNDWGGCLCYQWCKFLEGRQHMPRLCACSQIFNEAQGNFECGSTLSFAFHLHLIYIWMGHVRGAVNIICDAWQAGNTDGYFAVTGHWIQEDNPSIWKCESALRRLTKLNNMHNGKCLGGALFKVLDHSASRTRYLNLYFNYFTLYSYIP